MESSDLLYSQLKINNLKNNIILTNCLFVFDKLANNLPDGFDKFFKPFKELHNFNTRSYNSIYLMFLKLIFKFLLLIQ